MGDRGDRRLVEDIRNAPRRLDWALLVGLGAASGMVEGVTYSRTDDEQIAGFDPEGMETRTLQIAKGARTWMGLIPHCTRGGIHSGTTR